MQNRAEQHISVMVFDFVTQSQHVLSTIRDSRYQDGYPVLQNSLEIYLSYSFLLKNVHTLLTFCNIDSAV